MPRPPSVHGTRGCYIGGCRCEDCTEANRVYIARWRRARGVQPLRSSDQKLAVAKDGAGVRFRFHPARRAEAPLIWWRCGPATGLLMPMSIYDDPT